MVGRSVEGLSLVLACTTPSSSTPLPLQFPLSCQAGWRLPHTVPGAPRVQLLSCQMRDQLPIGCPCQAASSLRASTLSSLAPSLEWLSHAGPCAQCYEATKQLCPCNTGERELWLRSPAWGHPASCTENVTLTQGLPWGPVVETPCLQCREHRFDPCSGN